MTSVPTTCSRCLSRCHICRTTRKRGTASIIGSEYSSVWSFIVTSPWSLLHTPTHGRNQRSFQHRHASICLADIHVKKLTIAAQLTMISDGNIKRTHRIITSSNRFSRTPNEINRQPTNHLLTARLKINTHFIPTSSFKRKMQLKR